MNDLHLQFVPQIPVDYALSVAKLNWVDIKWAYDHQMFKEIEIIEFAKKINESSYIEEKLLLLDKLDLWRVGEILSDLNDICEEKIQDVILKWQYIVLSYVYDNRDIYTDILQKAEEIYADFGYQKNIQSFVRYMPSTDEDEDLHLKSAEKIKNILLERWKNYINSEKQKYLANL